VRDSSGNFSAGTITATLAGTASGNLPLSGGILTGILTIPAGSPSTPILQFTGSTNTGISAQTPNVVSVDVSGSEIMNVSASGVTVDAFTTAGVVHNNTSGLLSSSLIVNGDITDSTIANAKLAAISSANTGGNIVVRDSSGNFSAGTITASLTGNVTGTASGNLPLTGGTLAGPLLLPTGSSATPSLQIGATNIGLSSALSGLSLNTNGLERLAISSGGTVSIDGLAGTAGVVLNDSSGNLSSSLIVNSNIATSANIADIKLATISTAGKVANSATTATATASTNTIVSRDASGNFSAGTITANLIGNITGNASGNLPLTGGTLTGSLTLPAGSPSTPILLFSGSTNTGISAATANTLSFDVSGSEIMNVSMSGVTVDAFTTAGVVHNNTSGLLSSSLIVNGDITNATIANTKLATITSSNIANNIVVRDLSGNFSANSITANLTGTSTNFSAALVGDVTGTQSATVVSTVGGQSAANVASGAVLANAATNLDTVNTIVKRDSSGNFSAGTITANLIGNVTGTSTNFSAALVGDVTGTQSATVVSTVGGQSAANIASGAVLANAATNLDTVNTIVKRDSSGNFSAGTITANLIGNVTGTSTNFSAALVGDVTGTQSATVVSTVGGQSAANVASGAVLANAATNLDTVNTIVKRDPSGNFSAGTITANLIGNVTGTSTNFSGTLAGDVTGTQHATVVSTVGGQSAANVASGAVLANSATNLNTVNTIVKRDSSGNFSAGTITANFIGNVTGTASGNLSLSGGTLTGDLTLPAGSPSTPILQFTGTTAGISASSSNTLSLDVGGSEIMNVSASGVTVDAFTTAGVVHNNTSGLLSSSLIINGDITNATIANTKLATITSSNIANNIVVRDASGNFSAGAITATNLSVDNQSGAVLATSGVYAASVGTAGYRLATFTNQTPQVNWFQPVVPKLESYLFDDFNNSTTPFSDHNWTIATSGGGTSAASVAAGSIGLTDLGVISLITGASTSGVLYLKKSNGLYLGLGQFNSEWRVAVPTLSTVAQNFNLQFGISSNTVATTTAPTDGVFFSYNASNTDWRITTVSGGVSTSTNAIATGITVVANTYYRLAFTVNAAATSVSFFINDTLVGTLSSNIPSGTTHTCGPYAQITKTAGTTTGLNTLLDYCFYQYTFTTQR